ncbi:MAG: hypothetical protein IPI41_11250 [Flavobacteriales bacterium]|nr:hypothetical protein [Flavobacteriales bacterium]
MARRRQRNRPRPLRNALIVLLVSIATAELSPYALGRFLGYGAFDRDDVQASLGTALSVDTVRTERPAEEYLGDHFLHPYLGYVSVPLNDRNRFGLPGADPVMHASPDTVNMALLGGSVAMGLHTFSEQRLIKSLQRIPRFKGKPFRVTVFALGGFKQPQPLLALNYFLAQGAHYDVILTLDGFNDIVLPFCDNVGFGVFPSFPRHWNMYSRKRLDPRAERVLAERLFLAEQREQRRSEMAASIWRHSNLALLLWNARDRRDATALAALEDRLRSALATQDKDLQVTGPPAPFSDTAAFFSAQADMWMRSSLQVAALAKDHGALYAHFLQPNQYVPGSKPIGPKEAAVALVEGPFCYGDAVKRGYPMLIDRGKRLTEAGVLFEDLTMIYSELRRPVYNDNCCHVEPFGYDRIADRMSERLLQAEGDR